MPQPRWLRTSALRAELKGEVPSPIDPPPGCYFSPRCPRVIPRCREAAPMLIGTGEHQVACFLVNDD